MARAICKLGDNQYCEWSTIVDAPVTMIMSRVEAVAFFGEQRIARADKNGHSFFDLEPETPEELIMYNMAGPEETTLTLEEIIKEYTPPNQEYQDT